MKTYSSCMYLRDEGTWNTWAEWGASIGKGKVSLDTLVSDLNRNAPAIASSATPMAPSGAYLYGYTWESGDQSVEYWVPQGMTQGKIGDYYYAITSWYYNSDAPSGDPNPPVSPYSNKGVRISIANISQTSAGVTTQYRHLLLVHPTGTGTYEPVVNHAGGVVWIKNFLYLADTNNGMRVFDLSDIRAMSTDDTCSDKIGQVSTGVWCAYGYKYAVPELTKYLVSKIDNSSLPDTDVCFAKFSWLGKDSTQTQGVILSGEYCNDGSSPCTADPASAPGMGGRMYRWPYDSNGKLIAGDSGLVVAERAYTMNKRNVQGAAPVVQTSDRDDYRLASSRDYGSLFLVSLTIGWKEYDVGASTWSYYPEGTYASTTGSGHLWLVNEGREKSDGSYYTSPRDGGRALYAVDSDNMYNP
ncbi:secreted protein [Pelomyxa schiedti]|nr:secreted protein [Pelomyxa schiedti]